MALRPSLWRQFLAETLGTFVLVIFGIGATAQSVLSNRNKGGYLSVHFGWALSYLLGDLIAGKVSGGHLNPVVLVSLNIDNSTSWLAVLVLLTAQYTGAALAAGLCFLVYWDGVNWFEHQVGEFRPPQTAQIFSTFPLEHISVFSAFLDQFLGSMVLMVAMSAILDERNKIKPVARPVYYGATMLGVGVCLGSNCGVGLNPARDLSPRLVTSVLGWGLNVLSVSSYWSLLSVLASHAGGLAGVWLYRALLCPGGRKRPEETPRKEFKHSVQISQPPPPHSSAPVERTSSLLNLFTEEAEKPSPVTSPFKFGPLPPSPAPSISPSLNRMERITECTENLTSDTETESLASNQNFTLRKRKTENETPTLKMTDKPALTKQEIKKLQRELVKKPADTPEVSLKQPPPAPPPPPPPPPPLPSTTDHPVTTVNSATLAPVTVTSPLTSPCDCPAYLHDREAPLVISKVRQAVLVSRSIKHCDRQSKPV